MSLVTQGGGPSAAIVSQAPIQGDPSILVQFSLGWGPVLPVSLRAYRCLHGSAEEVGALLASASDLGLEAGAEEVGNLLGEAGKLDPEGSAEEIGNLHATVERCP